MRAVVCHRHGPPADLVIDTVDDPAPLDGEVVVDVAYAAMNHPDGLIVADRYQVSVPVPFVPGSEFAGIVRAVGTGVDTLAIGDRVFGAVLVGAYAEQVSAPAGSLRRAPDGVGLDVAAATWVAHATANHALRSVASVAPGERVAVLGAGGGVGLAAVELASLLGAEVIAVASSPDKLAACAGRGARHLIDHTRVDLRAELRRLAPDGVDVVIDPVGGALTEPALRALRWRGRHVCIGFASGEIPRIPLNLVLLKGCTVRGFDIRTFRANEPALAARDDAALLDLLASGRIAPHVSRTVALDEVPTALADMLAGRSVGKVLVEVR